jgi:hypothetical protein
MGCIQRVTATNHGVDFDADIVTTAHEHRLRGGVYICCGNGPQPGPTDVAKVRRDSALATRRRGRWDT